MIKRSDDADTGIVLHGEEEQVDKVLIDLGALMYEDHVDLDALFDALNAVARSEALPAVDHGAGQVTALTVGDSGDGPLDQVILGLDSTDGLNPLTYDNGDDNGGGF